MGSHRGDRDERPEHEEVTGGFYMDILPVTTSQFTIFLTPQSPNGRRQHAVPMVVPTPGVTSSMCTSQP